MVILSSVHLYPPNHLCGAEMMLHGVHKSLQSKGHTIKVLLKMSNRIKFENHYVWDDVDVFGADQGNEMNLFRVSDIAMTHLDYASWTQEMASINKIPCVHFIHNSHPRQHLYHAGRPQYIVYNSKWIADELKYPHEHFVLPPPVDYRHYDINSDPFANEYITLINLDQNKGGEILKEIATALPHLKFMGVIGSYSEPAAIGQILDQPDNVRIMQKQIDIRKVYQQTRILIMPSKYESWGRTATEAMCSGIPVIASPTQGLMENCGEAGIFVDRDDTKGWVKAIEKLYSEKAYRKASQKAKERSRQLDPALNLARFEQWLRESKAKYRQ